MSEREEVIDEFAGTMECCRVCLCGNENKAVKDMADEIVRLRSQLAAAESIAQAREVLIAALRADKDEARSQLTTAERERDEARDQLIVRGTAIKNLHSECDTLRHRAERAERVVEAAREWIADLWRGDLNGTAIGVCMEYEPDGQYALWEQVAPIAAAVRALDAAEGSNA